MKAINWKIIIITCIVCILPMFLGIYLLNDLPESVPIHFKVNNQADNFAPKEFVVFGFPFIMVALQSVCCIISDLKSRKTENITTFEKITKWIIPFITIVVYCTTIGIGVGLNIDVRKIISGVLSIIFVVMGIFLPQLDYVKNMKVDAKTAKKINRFSGRIMIFLGILMFITIFLPPNSVFLWFALSIISGIITAGYGIIMSKKQ